MKITLLTILKKATKDPDVISLFEGYIQFRDKYHVQKVLVNDSNKKVENQIMDETRNDPSSTGRTINSKKTQTINE